MAQGRVITIRTNKDVEEWNKDQRDGDIIHFAMIEPLKTTITTSKRTTIVGDVRAPLIKWEGQKRNKNLFKMIIVFIVLTLVFCILLGHLTRTLYPKVKKEVIDISREIKK